MVELPLFSDYRRLFLEQRPLIDTRTPAEFAEGTLPNSINLPLASNEERHQIGLCYKEQGPEAAIDLGHQLVSGELKAERVEAWRQYVVEHPEAVIYCWRGGLRSKISQQWLFEAHPIPTPRIEGGYKAVRRYLLDQLEQLPSRFEFLALAGRTGSGKSRLLRQLAFPHLDLERLANHRGSAFGHHFTPQPTQINFENQLAVELIQLEAAGHRHLLLEDEGRNIGQRYLPSHLYEKLHHAPLVVLEVSDEERVALTFAEYITDALAEAVALNGGDEAAGFEVWAEYLRRSLAKIERRLGSERYQQCRLLLERAFTEQQQRGDCSSHRYWIRALLLDYYDPMYNYQIEQRQQQIGFKGSAAEVVDYLYSQSPAG